jgi:hypothetical protein
MAQRARYDRILAEVFRRHVRPNKESFSFARVELERVAEELNIALPKNLGDVLYSFRFRKTLPREIVQSAPPGKEWVIELAGRGRYRFRLRASNRIAPREAILPIKVPDATPEIVSQYALTDEQALLARIRYNRLVDIFLGLTTYS